MKKSRLKNINSNKINNNNNNCVSECYLSFECTLLLLFVCQGSFILFISFSLTRNLVGTKSLSQILMWGHKLNQNLT